MAVLGSKLHAPTPRRSLVTCPRLTGLVPSVSGPAPTTGADIYLIRAASHRDDHWSTRLGEATLIRDDGTTMITVSVADQSQLHGVLVGLRDLGAVLLSLHILDEVH